MSDYKRIRVEQQGDVSVIHLVDSELFDRVILNEFQEELNSFVKATQIRKMVIDFGVVRNLSSEALNALIRARDWVVGNGGQLKLCDMRDSIREIFRVTNLDGTMFDIQESMPKALDAF